MKVNKVMVMVGRRSPSPTEQVALYEDIYSNNGHALKGHVNAQRESANP